MKELRIEADTEKLHEVVAFVEEQLEEMGCPMKTQMQVHIAVEEIFVNIASYAYTPGKGEALIRMDTASTNDGKKNGGDMQESDGGATEESGVVLELVFMDHGNPFNPLEREDPDMTLAADETKIGGLGIFMTKKCMDEVRYEYRDGMNILYLKKRF